MKATAPEVVHLSFVFLIGSFILVTVNSKSVVDDILEVEHEVRDLINAVEDAEELSHEELVEKAIKCAEAHNLYVNHTDARVEEIAEFIANLNCDEDNKEIVEGDIIVSKHDKQNVKRNMLDTRLWPRGIMPYDIMTSFSPHQRNAILQAMATISSVSCLKFQQRGSERDYVQFVTSSACSAYVGKTGGSQEIDLHPRCFHFMGIVFHEILHTLGFFHEQSRPDRDEYVTIVRDNIIVSKLHNFAKHTHSTTLDLGRNYDYGSVLHYAKTAFSANGRDTIVPKVKGVTLGNLDGLSGGDIIDLNVLYNCQGKTTYIGEWTHVGPCNEKCERTQQRFCGDATKCPRADSRGIETKTIVCVDEACTPVPNGVSEVTSGRPGCGKDLSLKQCEKFANKDDSLEWHDEDLGRADMPSGCIGIVDDGDVYVTYNKMTTAVECGTVIKDLLSSSNKVNCYCPPNDTKYVRVYGSGGCKPKCGHKGGICEEVCGTGGYCCRQGESDCPPEMASVAAKRIYSCVVPDNAAEKDFTNLVGTWNVKWGTGVTSQYKINKEGVMTVMSASWGGLDILTANIRPSDTALLPSSNWFLAKPIHYSVDWIYFRLKGDKLKLAFFREGSSYTYRGVSDFMKDGEGIGEKAKEDVEKDPLDRWSLEKKDGIKVSNLNTVLYDVKKVLSDMEEGLREAEYIDDIGVELQEDPLEGVN